MTEKCLNLGCGSVYVDSNSWTNVDYVQFGSSVRALNLLQPLPFASGAFDLVYSSHFFEHIPRSLVPNFLGECWRVLEPGGLLRLVLPDSEEMFKTYLSLRAANRHEQADFVMLEIVDQCVRTRVHGEMGGFYSTVAALPEQERRAWVDFIRQRTGQNLDDPGFFREEPSPALPSLAAGQDGLPSLRALISNPLCLPSWWQQVVHHVALRLLPAAFRVQNVSLSMIGERHHWLWDFHQLKSVLEKAGFESVCRVSHATSAIADFPFAPLDMTAAGLPRKGVDSLFVEAIKPAAHPAVSFGNP